MYQRVIVISLYNDGQIFPITSHSGVVAAINVLRPDGKSSSFPAEITGLGEISYEITAWPVGIAGDVKMSVALHTADGGRISTDPFILHVAEGLYLGSEINEDEEKQTAFENMMRELAEIGLHDEVRETNEEERKSNEYRRIEAENARAEGEIARIEAESLRGQVIDAMIEGLDNLLAIQEAYLSAAGGADE